MQSPLLHALNASKLDIAELLLQLGADPLATDVDSDYNALMQAVSVLDAKSVKRFLAALPPA